MSSFKLLKPDCEYLNNGEAPKVGDVVKLKQLAKTFIRLGEDGKDGFYKGEAIHCCY